ncbi:uncharacterized protein MICPUCDRAFT_60240 [Micromonas pusilla CCMP1545]|uniref:glycerophosphodiester phosphodiesterase n=1 Tax=Micromonas pusilla (strain CCMP1545) TaxID=564608 RepID=C1MXQ0_MICPC|nr:uncharacterized protein MICPUCDRAFT_60240 [Micromonas pusilla CCMP1545]EEH55499.1 predicted protein [Micromonas pusilla CCMP1545]|eukprot:XP_003060730.1 predicted protein [Micromonas pusilla CCMP1545]
MYALVVVLAWYVSGGRTAPSPVASSSSSSPVVLAPSPTFCARRDPIVCAHGTVGSADWPRSMGRRPFPNTVPALAAAVAAGHECVEVDASRTKDDHLVALHPRELKMLTGGRVGNPGDLTLAEIMSLTMPGAKEYRVATFAEAMAVVMNKGLTQITVDFKDGPPRREEGFASAVTREIARLGRSHGSGRSQSATTACPECVYWGKSDEIALDVLELTRGDAKARLSRAFLSAHPTVSFNPDTPRCLSTPLLTPFDSTPTSPRMHPTLARPKVGYSVANFSRAIIDAGLHRLAGREDVTSRAYVAAAQSEMASEALIAEVAAATAEDAPHGKTRTYAWTVNAPAATAAVVNAGVDGVVTDEPELVARVVRKLRGRCGSGGGGDGGGGGSGGGGWFARGASSAAKDEAR